MIASVSVISAADDVPSAIGDDVAPDATGDNIADNTGDGTGDDVEDNAEEDTGEDIATADEDVDDVGDNPYRHGALTPNEMAFQEEANASGENSNTISASGSPTTGNPILVLLAAMAILGAYPLSREK